MMSFTKNKQIKKIGIGLAAALLVCILIDIVKPIYYRVYPFDRFTVNYNISYNGEEVSCAEKYYRFEDSRKNVRNAGKHRFKIHGGDYGEYEIGLVVDNETLYGMTEDDIFLTFEDFEFKIVYFNANSWHITDIDINIEIVNKNGEWCAVYKVNYTEPDIDESGKTITESIEGEVLLKNLKESEISWYGL